MSKEILVTLIFMPIGRKGIKYRDLLKLWNVMEDENAIYVLLGSELQGLCL